MAKKARVRYLCTYCEARIHEGTSFCGSCGRPTTWATHDEKVAWELSQYESVRTKPIETIDSGPLPVIPRTYTRSAQRSAPARVTTTPTHAPSRPAATRTRSVDVAKPVRLPVQRTMEVELPDAEDAALLFKIVKILNQRITDLEKRVEELQGADDQVVVSR
jgi:hypothetical protein